LNSSESFACAIRSKSFHFWRWSASAADNRARIAIWHLDDPETGSPDRWIARANDYLTYVERFLGRIDRA
jgi:hypothetical protein